MQDLVILLVLVVQVVVAIILVVLVDQLALDLEEMLVEVDHHQVDQHMELVVEEEPVVLEALVRHLLPVMVV